MLIITKKLRITQRLKVFLTLLFTVVWLLLASCYTLYPAPSGTAGSSSTTGGNNTVAQAQPGSNTQGSSPAAPVFTPPPPVTGTVVPGDSVAQKLAWLQRSAESHNTYIVEVSANENIAPQVLEYRGAINITVAFRGMGENRTIRLSTNGTMFDIRANVTFVLEENITLHGHSQNSGFLVYVNGGIFLMNPGSSIIGNSRTGVVVSPRGTFEMNGGTISGNTASEGAGVFVSRDIVGKGRFTMRDGTISDNTATRSGGGVLVGDEFEMIGGTISGNSALYGGGVFIAQNGDFTMRGGTITGNTAREWGGGVYMEGIYNSRFTKTGGTITGYSSDQTNGNVVRDIDGVLARRGHAVFSERGERRRETTAGPGVNLSAGSDAGWEQ